MTINRYMIMAILLWPIPSMAQFDGFNKGAGNTDIALSAAANIGSDYWAGDELIGLQRTISSFSVFAAHGITNDFDATVQIPFVMVNDVSGLQDGQVFLKWMPLTTRHNTGGWKIGLTGGASFPLSDYETEGLNAIGQQATRFGAFAIVHHQWDNGVFAGLSGGRFIAQDPVPDADVFSARIGLARDQLFLELSAELQNSTGNKDYRGVGDAMPSNFREIAVSYLRVGLKGYISINDRSGAAIGLTYVPSGMNADKALGIGLSYIIRLSKGQG